MRTTLAAGLLLATGLSGCSFFESLNRSNAHNYVTVPHVSYHINPQKDFNEFNPGIGIGSEAPIARTNWNFGVEAGRFRNSLDDQSSYLGIYSERDLLPVSNPGRLKLGAFLAYAEYPTEVQKAKDRGFATLGDFVPVAGLQATVATVSRHEFRFRLSPGLTQADGILTLQSNWRF